MGSKSDMTRKDFLTLTFTLIGTTAVGVAACSSDNNNAIDGGGRGGTTGNGGRGGTTGAGGTSSGGAGGTGGGAGTSANGGGGGTSSTACTDPLPETMVPDSAGHTHTVTIAASALNGTVAVVVDTSVAEAGTPGAHMHAVTLDPSHIATLKGGGMVTLMSTIVMSHGHMFTISCH